MSFPPRPPMVPGMPPLFMGVPGMPPGMGNMGIPPPMMQHGNRPGGMQFFGGRGPPPLMRPPPMSQNHGTISKPPMTSLDDKPSDHPQPLPQPTGPPVTVFVGNITEKWPDAMIRQLLATCGQVINWKRIQGASGKLQGFGFCEFNGPDAGLRAVRLLHELEVGDKKLVVKVDAKTSSVLEEFKAERKKIKTQADADEAKNGEKDDKKTEEGEIPDYMDQEMKESDERSRQRVAIIFREFKNEIDAYIPPGSEKAKSEKESSANKQQIQDKLHLLKLSSLENTSGADIEPDLPEDLAMEEGKREIITREISIFRESMKQEKQREEERKKIGRERREKEREREERKRTREKGTEDINSPDHLSFRDRDRFSPRRDKGGGSNDRGRGDRGGSRDNRRDRRGRDDRERGDRRDRLDRDRPDRDRRRDRSRDRSQRKSKSRSVERIPRSPPPPSMGPKPRYREREEEEEQGDQKRLERKAREKEAAYEERLREWEGREGQKAREYKKLKDRRKRQEEDMEKEAKRMKQFLEDYDDEKHDSKYYRGKDLQRRLAERAKELEDDNKDRQKEREELEEMKLRMLTSSSRLTPNTGATSTPNILLDRYKKPAIEMISSVSTPSPASTPLFTGLKMELKPSINSRLQAIANNQSGNNNLVTTNNHVNAVEKEKSEPPTPHPTAPTQEPQKTSFESIQFNAFNAVKSTSNPSTPNSLTSPAQPLNHSPIPTAVNLTLSLPASNSSPIKRDDEESRQSFGSAPSPGMPSASPQNFNNEGDDSSMQSPLDAPKKKRMDVKDIFNQDEDDDGFGMGRKRKLVPLDFGEEANKKLKKDDKNPEEKKKHIKALIDKIPTEKDALFEYEIDWEMVDTTLMEKRIRPWINKKIVEYIGEPEPTLVDFICSKVLGRSAPRSILDDVMMVLDEEAEVFVVKMWRLLVYEIEAKKYGLAGKAQ